MALFSRKYPLWLPPGSVRALLAIGLTSAAITSTMRGIRAEPLWGAAGMAIRDYFAHRKRGDESDRAQQDPGA